MPDKKLESPDMGHQDNIEAMKQYHNTLFDNLRHIESNAITLLGTLLPAVGGFTWALNEYLSSLQSQTQLQPNKQVLLFSVTVAAIVVLAWGLYHILALSYSYRYLVLVISNLEEKLCLSKFTPNWKTRNEYNVSKYGNILSPFNIAPAELRTHLCILSMAILGLAIIYQHIQGVIGGAIVLISGTFTVFISLILAHNIYPSKLHKCYQEMKTKMEEKECEQKSKPTETEYCKGIDWPDIVIIFGLAGVIWLLKEFGVIIGKYLGPVICLSIALLCWFRWKKSKTINGQNSRDKKE